MKALKGNRPRGIAQSTPLPGLFTSGSFPPDFHRRTNQDMASIIIIIIIIIIMNCKKKTAIFGNERIQQKVLMSNFKTYFMDDTTLHVAQFVNTEQLYTLETWFV